MITPTPPQDGVVLPTNAHDEIERRFLLRRLPEHLSECPQFEILQGYLAIEHARSEVRLRQIGNDDRMLTVKTKTGSGTRIEREILLSKRQFADLWSATAGRRLRKTRYRVPCGGLTIEVDVFHGSAAGVIVAEVEFPNLDARAAFRKPDWMGEEITGMKEYSNHFLATE